MSGSYEADGGANRNRTDDLLNAIQTLSQLSYGPTMPVVVLGTLRRLPVAARVLSSRASLRTQAAI